VDFGGRHFEEVAVLADGDLPDKVRLVIDLGVGLGDDLALFLVGGEVFDLVGNLAVLRDAVRRLDEAKLVDAGVGREGVDEADVRTFRSLDGADAAVVRRMDVAHFKAGALAVETTRPERGEAALVRDLGEGVDLVHELRQLAAGEEIADDGRQRLRIDELLRRDRIDALVIHRHALAHETLGAAEADTALVGEQLADGTDAAGAEVIDIVHDALALFEADEVLRGGNDIGALEDALLDVGLEAELLVDLVTADAAEVIALGIEEEALQQGLGVRGGRRLAGTEALVDFLERFLLVAGRVLLQGADEGTLVQSRVDDTDRGDVVLLEGADDLLGERLEGARQHHALLGVDGVLNEDERRNILQVQRLGNLEILDLVEEVQQVDVAGVAHGAEQRGDEELAATATAVEIDVEQVVVVELHLQPGAAVGNDAEGMEQLAVRVRRDLEGDAGRTVELGDDDALGAVDDEGAALRHHRDLAHVDFLVLDEVLFAEAELHIERHRVGDAVTQALDLGALGVAQGVGDVFERQPAVVGLDGEDLAENRLEALGLALFFRHALLQEIQIGGDLDLNQVGRLNDFAEFAEVDAFGVSAVGHVSSRLDETKEDGGTRSGRGA
jgi:hypothetical protein